MTDIDRSGFISLEVEENDNCYGMPLMTYQTLGIAFEIYRKLQETEKSIEMMEIIVNDYSFDIF